MNMDMSDLVDVTDLKKTEAQLNRRLSQRFCNRKCVAPLEKITESYFYKICPKMKSMNAPFNVTALIEAIPLGIVFICL
jgi:glycine betaine/choline ABC-type transport system substrate-binding protein